MFSMGTTAWRLPMPRKPPHSITVARRADALALVRAEGSQLLLATVVVATPADAPSFGAAILGLKPGIGLPKTVPAEAVAALEAQQIEPLVAIGRTALTTSAPHPSRRPRAASPNPGAAPCGPSWRPLMPKPAAISASGPSSPASVAPPRAVKPPLSKGYSVNNES